MNHPKIDDFNSQKGLLTLITVIGTTIASDNNNDMMGTLEDGQAAMVALTAQHIQLLRVWGTERLSELEAGSEEARKIKSALDELNENTMMLSYAVNKLHPIHQATYKIMNDEHYEQMGIIKSAMHQIKRAQMVRTQYEGWLAAQNYDQRRQDIEGKIANTPDQTELLYLQSGLIELDWLRDNATDDIYQLMFNLHKVVRKLSCSILSDNNAYSVLENYAELLREIDLDVARNMFYTIGLFRSAYNQCRYGHNFSEHNEFMIVLAIEIGGDWDVLVQELLPEVESVNAVAEMAYMKLNAHNVEDVEKWKGMLMELAIQGKNLYNFIKKYMLELLEKHNMVDFMKIALQTIYAVSDHPAAILAPVKYVEKRTASMTSPIPPPTNYFSNMTDFQELKKVIETLEKLRGLELPDEFDGSSAEAAIGSLIASWLKGDGSNRDLHIQFIAYRCKYVEDSTMREVTVYEDLRI